MPETELGAEAWAAIRDALNYIVTYQEPFAAVVVDIRWNVVQANKGEIAMVEFLVGPLRPDVALNLSRCSGST